MFKNIITGPNKMTSNIKPASKPKNAYPTWKLLLHPLNRMPIATNPAIGITHNAISTKI